MGNASSGSTGWPDALSDAPAGSRARLRASALYRYFHNTDDLLLAVADRIIGEVHGRLRAETGCRGGRTGCGRWRCTSAATRASAGGGSTSSGRWSRGSGCCGGAVRRRGRRAALLGVRGHGAVARGPGCRASCVAGRAAGGGRPSPGPCMRGSPMRSTRNWRLCALVDLAAGGSFEAARWSCCCRLWSWPRRSRSEPRLPGAGCAWLVSAVPRAPEVRTFGAHLPLKARRSRVPSGARAALRSHRPARGQTRAHAARYRHVAPAETAPAATPPTSPTCAAAASRAALVMGDQRPVDRACSRAGPFRPLLLVKPRQHPRPERPRRQPSFRSPPSSRSAAAVSPGGNARSMGEISSVRRWPSIAAKVLLDLGEPRWPGDARGRQRCGGRLQDPAPPGGSTRRAARRVRDHPESSQQVAGLQLRDVDARNRAGPPGTREHGPGRGIASRIDDRDAQPHAARSRSVGQPFAAPGCRRRRSSP